MTNEALENGLAALDFARRNTLAFIEDIPEDKLCHQVSSAANHAMWIIGHLAWTDDHFLKEVGGRTPLTPAAWSNLFGMGSVPKPDRSAYPALADLKKMLADTHAARTAWLRSLPPDKLDAPLPDSLRPFARSHCALASTLAWHEGLHAGQLTMIRRSIGLKPKIG